ncbi:hypothetical protein V8E36_002377 [Tilletia maclaganii]
MPDKQAPGFDAPLSSQDWRKAAYTATQKAKVAAPSAKSEPDPTPSTSSVSIASPSSSKTRSSTTQQKTQASGFLKSSGSSKDVGFNSSSGSGLARLPLYSSKATDEIRSLTSKKGMKSEDNPITHSRMGERTQHYQSSSTGHQVANHMMASFPVTGWRDIRQAKMREQAAESSSKIFQGVTAYLNGYQGEDQINLDITRKIQENGGKVNYLYSKSLCTHIISSRALSAKKNQEWLIEKRKSATIAKLVRPEWVYDSIAAGKRLAETKYPVFSDQTQSSILSAFGWKDDTSATPSSTSAAPISPTPATNGTPSSSEEAESSTLKPAS